MMDARRGHKRRRYLRIDRSRVVPYVLVVTNKNPSVLTSAIDQKLLAALNVLVPPLLRVPRAELFVIPGLAYREASFRMNLYFEPTHNGREQIVLLNTPEDAQKDRLTTMSSELQVVVHVSPADPSAPSSSRAAAVSDTSGSGSTSSEKENYMRSMARRKKAAKDDFLHGDDGSTFTGDGDSDDFKVTSKRRKRHHKTTEVQAVEIDSPDEGDSQVASVLLENGAEEEEEEEEEEEAEEEEDIASKMPELAHHVNSFSGELKRILRGGLPSWRRDAFLGSNKARDTLKATFIPIDLLDEEVDAVMELLLQKFCSAGHESRMPFVLDVLLPEAVIRLVMARKQLPYDQVDRMMLKAVPSAYLAEVNSYRFKKTTIVAK